MQEVSRSNSAHFTSACSHTSDLSSFHLWTIVGEWTTAPTDCAKYLNGLGRGARYDGTYTGSTYVGSCTTKTGAGSNFSSSYKAFLREYWEAQVITYENGVSVTCGRTIHRLTDWWYLGDGWVYWTWKAENADDWSYQAGLKYGWIPQDPTARQYPDVCG